MIKDGVGGVEVGFRAVGYRAQGLAGLAAGSIDFGLLVWG